MKSISKILWALCVLSFLILIAVRFILGGWQNYLILPLVLFVVSLTLALLADLKLYIAFLGMKTTRKGMSMGAMILLSLVLLISTNILVLKRNKTFDMTSNKLHSLSDQSREILKSIQQDLQITYFYKGKQDEKTKSDVGALVDMYQRESSWIQLLNIDAYVHKLKADEYLKGMTQSQQVMLFVEYKGKRIRVESPVSESTLTSALIKATRLGERKKIAFLQGHGEKEVQSLEENGLSSLKQALESTAFEVSNFSYIEGNEIPDVDIIAIVGPMAEIFKDEQKQLLDFARKGGALFIALDPGERHNMKDFVRRFEVQFNNDYILNDKSKVIGRGLSAAFGILFDAKNPITQKFKQNFVLFDVASSLDLLKDSNFKKNAFIKSSPDSFVMKSIQGGVSSGKNYFTMGVSVEGELPGGEQKTMAVFYGDSDFLSNKDIIQGLNMDLAINSIAHLAQERDLVNIKPKSIAGTRMILTSLQRNAVVIFCLSIPVLFFIISSLFWFRRRSS